MHVVLLIAAVATTVSSPSVPVNLANPLFKDQSNSCDEYPYASSEQGGAGAVTRCVPAHENSVQVGLGYCL